MPCSTSTPSFAARARTTRLVSLDRIRIGTPALRSRSMPSPSDRLTRTDSWPSSFTSAESSVCTPSKSVITTSTSTPTRGSSAAASALASTRSWSWSISTALSSATGTICGPAEEAVPSLPEPGHRHHVEGAGLAVVRLPVLAARPVGGVVVDPGGLAVGSGSPEELIRRHRREHRVGLAAGHPADRLVQIGRVDERAGALDEDDHLRVDAAGGERVQRVQQRGLRAGRVAGELGRAGRPPRRRPPGPPRRSRHRRC